MHVCLVTETYPPEVNGVALTLQTLARGLRAHGHAVSLVRPRQPGVAAEAEFPELLVPGARLPRYPDLRFGLPSPGRVRAFWRQHRPDVVYAATEGPLGWTCLRAAREIGAPVATGFHTRFDDYFGHYGLRLLTPLAFAWLRRFHNRAHATYVPTRELADSLSARGIRNVHLLQRSVDVRRFDPAWRDPALRARWGLAPDDLAVLYVGRIAPEKNLALAVRAFRALQAVRPEARFVWVGDGPARARLAQDNPDFVFAGVQRGDELARHYASGDLFVFPSLTETFGNVTLEAMASGVATVAFDYGAAREHIDRPELGCAVASGDEAAFVAAAVALAADDRRRRAIGASARAALCRREGAGVAARFADLLHDLHARHAA
ncbi:MAG: glycosyltransferase family 1 protein [Pseudoxanthomonas sp.]|nr:glycosyltransferase family 1 protein [Pseudoxanthomonas sp.]